MNGDINPFTILIRVIEDKAIPSRKEGVMVYPLGDAVGVHYTHHFVIGLSEQEGRMKRKHASFLESHEVDESKRKSTDVTGNLIQLYMESNDNVRFSSSNMTFDGAVIPLCEFSRTEKLSAGNMLEDPYQKERDYTIENNQKRSIPKLMKIGYQSAKERTMLSQENSVTDSLLLPTGQSRQSYSFSRIRTYSECPFRYLMERTFGMDKVMKYEGTDYDASQIGTTLHATLEKYMNLNSNAIDYEALERYLDEELNLWEDRKKHSRSNEAELEPMDDDTPILTEDMRTFIISKYLEGLKETVRYIIEDIKPEEASTEVSMEGKTIKYEDKDIAFTGFIDLLLKTADGYRMIDYKTNDADKKSMQFEVYSELLKNDDIDVVKSEYITLKDGESIEDGKDHEDIHEYVGKAVEGIESGVWTLASNDNACEYCKYKSICHRGYNVK